MGILRLAFGPGCAFAASAMVYTNSSYLFTNRCCSRRNVCCSALRSSTNYSSVFILGLAMLSRGGVVCRFTRVYSNSACSFTNRCCSRRNVCCSALRSSTNYSSVMTLVLEIGPMCGGAICRSVYRNNSCLFTKGSHARSNECISSTGAVSNYSSVAALVLAIGGSCGGAMDTAVYTGRACDFYNIRCGASKLRRRECRSGSNYSSMVALGLAMLPTCGFIAATAVYSKRDCSFERGSCGGSKACRSSLGSII